MSSGLTIPVLPLAPFNYDEAQKTLTAFLSDFGPYEVSLKEGISIKSHYTGKVEAFKLLRVEKDAEGDVLAYHFAPRSAQCRVKGVTIYND